MHKMYWNIFDAILYQTLCIRFYSHLSSDEAHRTALKKLRLRFIKPHVVDGFIFKQMPLKKNFQRAVYTREMSMRHVHSEIRAYFETRCPARTTTVWNLLEAGHYDEAAEKIYCDQFVKQQPKTVTHSISQVVNRRMEPSAVTSQSDPYSFKRSPSREILPLVKQQTAVTAVDRAPSITPKDIGISTTRIDSPTVTKRSDLFNADSISPDMRSQRKSPPVDDHTSTEISSISLPLPVITATADSRRYESASKQQSIKDRHKEQGCDINMTSQVAIEKLAESNKEADYPPLPQNVPVSAVNKDSGASQASNGTGKVVVESRKRANTSSISIPKKKKRLISPVVQKEVVSNLTTWVESILPPPECDQNLAMDQASILIHNALPFQDISQAADLQDATDINFGKSLTSNSGSEYQLSDHESDVDSNIDLQWNDDELAQLELSMPCDSMLRDPPVKCLPEIGKEQDFAECHFCGGFYSRVRGGAIKQHILYWCQQNPDRQDINRLIRRMRGYRLSSKFHKTGTNKRSKKIRKSKKHVISPPVGVNSPTRQESTDYAPDTSSSPALLPLSNGSDR